MHALFMFNQLWTRPPNDQFMYCFMFNQLGARSRPPTDQCMYCLGSVHVPNCLNMFVCLFDGV